MLTNAFEKSSLDSAETAVLLKAYAQAVIAVGGVFQLDNAMQAKLAKIVLAVGNNRIKAGGELSSAEDAESVATIASKRLLQLLADGLKR